MNAVIVPDFTGPRGLVFEARTLFFLASWLETFGADGGAAGWQPHVCCVGEPPERVWRMAARAGASLSVHEPLLPGYGGFANKLRGLEAPGGAGERTLLLDADMLVLGPLDLLAGIDADLAAVPGGKPQVPAEQWRLIYDALDLPMPTERIASAHGEHRAALDRVTHRYEGQEAEAGTMLPYFNSGTILARRTDGLRGVWEEYLQRIPAVFTPRGITPAHAVTNGDQVALAAAIHALRLRGATFQLLPDAFNARLVHFRTGALRVNNTRLLHAAGFAGFVRERSDLMLAVENYEERWSEAIRQGLNDDPDALAHDLNRVRVFLWNLWERWVREVWES